MRKGHSIIGLQVLSQNDGTNLGKVLDLVFDHDANACIGLMLREKGFLKSAQVVSWDNIITIGKDAVMVKAADIVVDPITLPKFRAVMEQDTHLSGTQIVTEDGRNLGTFADIYVDETTGRVVGYEVSGGFVSDTMSGKRYVSADRTHDVHVGNDVLIASRELSDEFERQAHEEPGGLQPVLASAGEKVNSAYASAKDKVTETYTNVANASVEKQKEFVVGKTSGRDVFLPAPTLAATDVIVEDNAPILADQAASEAVGDVELEHGPRLVASGQTITAEHAQQAEQAGILHQLLLAAGVGAANNATAPKDDSTSPHVITHPTTAPVNSVLSTDADTVVGRTAKQEVLLPNGSTLIAPGMVVTTEIASAARLHNKEAELASATSDRPHNHSTSQNSAHSAVESIGASATTMFETIKNKVAELTGTAQEKKAGFDEAAQQKKINNALGRPVTRIILDRSDAVILNTGDIITHRAIERAKEADMLDVLLDSVYDTTPAITPEMMSVKEPGEASLPEQARPADGPILTRDANQDEAGSSNANNPSAQQPQEQLERS